MRQRMFHGSITAAALADQLAARFQDRQHKTTVRHGHGTALIQIGSKHGTPATVNIADTEGGVLVTLSRDRDWLDRVADGGEMIERAAAGNPLSMLAMLPDVIGELRKDNLAPEIWDAINEICALSRALAGEEDAPANPIVCPFCATPNPAGQGRCVACGAPLPVDLPRVCPKCGRGHTSDALFCQACGVRLVEG
ncbi:MAG: zinc ribbon domain-containing protein [Anaerolineae bacterium]|nr:zinc ribbon domain-containing protein [Anaerolineae bacterium]